MVLNKNTVADSKMNIKSIMTHSRPDCVYMKQSPKRTCINKYIKKRLREKSDKWVLKR